MNPPFIILKSWTHPLSFLKSWTHPLSVVKDASSYYDYRKHFSIYVATKVAENDLKLFEQKVVSAWRQKSK